jgi:hypothetical protein
MNQGNDDSMDVLNHRPTAQDEGLVLEDPVSRRARCERNAHRVALRTSSRKEKLSPHSLIFHTHTIKKSKILALGVAMGEVKGHVWVLW